MKFYHWSLYLGLMCPVNLLATGTQAEVLRTIREPVTGAQFPTTRSLGKQQHLLIGVGVRKVWEVITIYGAGMYVGAEESRNVWKRYRRTRFRPFMQAHALDFRRLRESEALSHYLIYGTFPKALDMVFVRSTTKTQCNREFREGLGLYLNDLNAAEVRTDVQQFFDDVSIRMTPGDHSLFRTQGENLWVTGPDGRTRLLRNRSLVHAFWNMYFGREPIQSSLSRGLLSRLAIINEETNVSQ